MSRACSIDWNQSKLQYFKKKKICIYFYYNILCLCTLWVIIGLNFKHWNLLLMRSCVSN